MVDHRCHLLETHATVEFRRLKAVGRHEHDPTCLRARVLLDRLHQLATDPSAAQSLCDPEIRDVAATTPRVAAYTGLDVTSAAFTDRGKRLAVIVSRGGCVVLVDTLGEERLNLRSVASANRDRHNTYPFAARPVLVVATGVPRRVRR